MKFSPGQLVIVPQFMINGSRLDIEGEVLRYVRNPATKQFKAEVLINCTYVLLSDDRLVDAKEFHENKNKHS